ncbi:MAG TPA: hypothetical protein DEB35_10615 [Desulfuromonas sp.]|nr:hypothetical protein [Desulfuromonas sp.]HBT83815.1 hypothetical protein [Desulfuromonas sp.]
MKQTQMKWQRLREQIGKRSILFALGGLTFLCVLLYANTLDNDFVLDDNAYIIDNYYLRDIGNLWKFIDVPTNAVVADLEPGFLRGRNVRWLTYAVDYALGDGRAFPFHLSNLLWHLATVAALFLLIRSFLHSSGMALLVAALFAAHPIQTAAVSYISGRKDLLAAFFVLAAFLLLERYRHRGKVFYLAATGLLFVVGFFSKEGAIVFPLLLLWSDWCREDRLSLSTLTGLLQKNWGQYAFLFGIAGLLAARTLGVEPLLHLVSPASIPDAAVAATASMLGENRSYANLMIFYGLKLLWPFQLVADYRGVFTFSLYPPAWGVWLSPVFALFCAASIWLLHRWRPFLALGLGWFLLALLPVSHLIPFHYPVAEHYLYLPSIGFCLMCVGLFPPPRLSLPFVLGWFLLLLVLTTATIMRNRSWQDMETLTYDILQKVPHHQGARDTLVHLLIQRGELQRALIEGEEALRQDPMSSINHYNLGIINENLDHPESARRHYYQAITLQPRLWDAYVNLGNLLMDQGEVAEGTAVLQRLMRLYGYHPLALWVLANQQAREGDWVEAQALYRQQITLDKNDASGYLGLAGSAWYLGRPEWREDLRRALAQGLDVTWAKGQPPWKNFFEEPEIKQFITTTSKAE